MIYVVLALVEDCGAIVTRISNPVPVGLLLQWIVNVQALVARVAGSKSDGAVSSSSATKAAANTSIRNLDHRGGRAVRTAPENRLSSKSTAASLDAAPEERTTPSIQEPAVYEVPWQTVIAGSGTATSPDYSSDIMVGESLIGESSNDNYDVSVGSVYMLIVSDGGCACPSQGDFNADGFRDSSDLNDLIIALFFNGPDPQDPACPTTRGDFNNDGVSDSADLNELIGHLFFNGPLPVDPCVP